MDSSSFIEQNRERKLEEIIGLLDDELRPHHLKFSSPYRDPTDNDDKAAKNHALVAGPTWVDWASEVASALPYPPSHLHQVKEWADRRPMIFLSWLTAKDVEDLFHALGQNTKVAGKIWQVRTNLHMIWDNQDMEVRGVRFDVFILSR